MEDQDKRSQLGLVRFELRPASSFRSGSTSVDREAETMQSILREGMQERRKRVSA